MQPFDELTETEKALRLGQLASEVAERDFGLKQVRIRIVGASLNSMFRVDSSDGRFAMRIGDACRLHAVGSEDVEANWLRLLSRDGFNVAVNVPSLDHRAAVTAGNPSVHGDRVCSLFTWVPGRPVAEKISESALRECGALLAQLHEHGASTATEIDNPDVVKANRAVYMPPENRVLHHQSQFGSLLVDAQERTQALIDSLWRDQPHSPHLLHGRYGPATVMTWVQDLYPVSFQDLLFGFDLQDVALTLADLRRRDPDLVQAFTAGYTQIRPWPHLDPDLEQGLAVARSLNQMNVGIHRRRPGLGEYLEGHCRRIRRWMEPVS